ncbi:hypothetical protein C8R42DRAFT_724797 [Lentinula raphanica]|nr:hypothetical protein C8R42DRAFT_724797 [Lentinula raphanica]
MSTGISSTDVALINGPYVLGGVFSYGLFGILVVQLFFYHYSFVEQDPLWLKTFVYVLAIFDLVITILCTNFIWQVLAQHWGGLVVLVGGEADATGAITFLSGIVASMAHAFYAWRIYRLTNSKFLPIVVMLISLTTCAMAGYCSIKGAQIGLTRFSEMKIEGAIWLGGSTLCDFLITFILVFQLFHYKRHTVSAHSRNTLLRLITLTVETGLVTALTALVELLLVLIIADSTLYFIPLFMQSKVKIINPRTGSGDKHPLWVDLDETGTLIDGSQLHFIPPVPPQVDVRTTVCQDHDVELVIRLPDSGQEETCERNILPSAMKASTTDMYMESDTSHAELDKAQHGYSSLA